MNISTFDSSKHYRHLFPLILILLLSGPALSEPKLSIIANSDVPVDTLSVHELREIYLGNSHQWKNKTKIMPSYFNSKAEQKQLFFEEYLGISPMKFRRHWLKRVFSGQGTAPLSFEKMEEVVDYVSKTSGAIGFVIEPEIDSTLEIKTIVIDASVRK